MARSIRRPSSRPVRASSCRRRRAQTDGYEAVQLGLVEERPAKVGKPLAGHYKKANVPPTRVRREVKLQAGGEALEGRRSGARRRSSPTASASTSSAPAAARGFRASCRRHHFAGGAATHGSMFHRAPGSIGASSFPVARRQGHARGGPDGRRPRDDSQPEGAAGRCGQPSADRRRRHSGRADGYVVVRKARDGQEASRSRRSRSRRRRKK